MKNKKVYNILKGIGAAGVAFGGASAIQGADVVLAATTEETVDAGAFEDSDVSITSETPVDEVAETDDTDKTSAAEGGEVAGTTEETDEEVVVEETTPTETVEDETVEDETIVDEVIEEEEVPAAPSTPAAPAGGFGLFGLGGANTLDLYGVDAYTPVVLAVAPEEDGSAAGGNAKNIVMPNTITDAKKVTDANKVGDGDYYKIETTATPSEWNWRGKTYSYKLIAGDTSYDLSKSGGEFKITRKSIGVEQNQWDNGELTVFWSNANKCFILRDDSNRQVAYVLDGDGIAIKYDREGGPEDSPNYVREGYRAESASTSAIASAEASTVKSESIVASAVASTVKSESIVASASASAVASTVKSESIVASASASAEASESTRLSESALNSLVVEWIASTYPTDDGKGGVTIDGCKSGAHHMTKVNYSTKQIDIGWWTPNYVTVVKNIYIYDDYIYVTEDGKVSFTYNGKTYTGELYRCKGQSYAIKVSENEWVEFTIKNGRYVVKTYKYAVPHGAGSYDVFEDADYETAASTATSQYKSTSVAESQEKSTSVAESQAKSTSVANSEAASTSAANSTAAAPAAPAAPAEEPAPVAAPVAPAAPVVPVAPAAPVAPAQPEPVVVEEPEVVPEVIEEEEVPLGVVEDEADTIEIDEDETPLVNGKADGLKTWWWWIAAAAAGVGGKGIYDSQRRKAKKNKKNDLD